MFASLIDQLAGLLCFCFLMFLLIAGGITVGIVKIMQSNGKTKDAVKDAAKNVGKKAAGRVLDGRTWDELPVLTSSIK